jgi:hypothetical protein
VTAPFVGKNALLREAGMNAQLFIDGPIGSLFYQGPAWTLLAVVVFFALILLVKGGRNQSQRKMHWKRQKKDL